jgi:hypothetical protein
MISAMNGWSLKRAIRTISPMIATAAAISRNVGPSKPVIVVSSRCGIGADVALLSVPE